MKRRISSLLALGFLAAAAAHAAPSPVSERVPLVKLNQSKSDTSIVVLSEVGVPRDAGIVYFQNGKRIEKAEVSQAEPYCTLHLGKRTWNLSPGSELPLVGGSYHQSYLSSFMLYTKVSESEVGQIYCEKPSPKDYLDKGLQFSVKDFNEVFAGLLQIQNS